MTPRETVSAWALTLTEPLLPLGRRTLLETQMRQVCADHPAWASLALGGVLSDLVRTLPDSDPWRHSSARLGDATLGPQPPDTDGARLPNGTRLGHWEAFVDVLGQPMSEHVEDDPHYGWVVDGIPPVSEAIIALSRRGWQSASEAVSASAIRGEPTSAVDDLTNLPGINTLRASPLYTYGVPALRWALYRRRSYGIPAEDAWVNESIYRWTWRAGRILGAMTWDEDQIEARQVAERIHPLDEDIF